MLIGVGAAVLAVGVTLGGVILTGLRGIRGELKDLRDEMGQVRSELHGEIVQLGEGLRGELGQGREELRGAMNELRRDMGMRLSSVERQQAKLEGLREAITGHRAA